MTDSNQSDTQTQSLKSKPSQEENTVVPIPPWGRLISCKIGLPCLDLVNHNVTFGRNDTCDVIISEKNFRNCKIVSKVHFKIEKNDDDLIYLIDCSKNGTSVNSAGTIGKNNKRILKDNDLISVGSPAINVYIFKYYKDIDKFLPEYLQSKYESVKVLGRGACGEVHLVIDRTTCELWAVKKIILGKSNVSQMHKLNHPSKIQREVTILKSLSHPGIIKLREIYETGKEVYIVLEYMSGGELTDRILSVNKMSEADAKFLFFQMVLAVQYLHSLGVVHRDLKPENILLNDVPNGPMVKLSDFGLSKDTEQSMMETACGTLYYVAPEVLHQEYRGHYGEYGKNVDIWSLGVILYYMLAQELPFQSKERGILCKQIVTGRYQMDSPGWKNLSPQAKDLVNKMLVTLPHRRISIQEILLHPWLNNDRIIVKKLNLMLQNYSSDTDKGEEDGPQQKKFKFCKNISFDSNESSNDLITE